MGIGLITALAGATEINLVVRGKYTIVDMGEITAGALYCVCICMYNVYICSQSFTRKCLFFTLFSASRSLILSPLPPLSRPFPRLLYPSPPPPPRAEVIVAIAALIIVAALLHYHVKVCICAYLICIYLCTIYWYLCLLLNPFLQPTAASNSHSYTPHNSYN